MKMKENKPPVTLNKFYGGGGGELVCYCPPGFLCRCRKMSSGHLPKTAVMLTATCHCPPSFCSCEQEDSTDLIFYFEEEEEEDSIELCYSCWCPKTGCRCRVKTPVHDPDRAVKLSMACSSGGCECPPGFCRCAVISDVDDVHT